MTSGKFYVDPEILSSQVKKGQEVIWSENNPNYDIIGLTDGTTDYSDLIKFNGFIEHGDCCQLVCQNGQSKVWINPDKENCVENFIKNKSCILS